MAENKRFKIYIDYSDWSIIDTTGEYVAEDYLEYMSQKQVCDLLNEQDERIKDLLRYKYLVKALEEVSGSHYIEEIISDYSDGAVSDEKEQLELGKWHSEHGLSWEDGDIDD